MKRYSLPISEKISREILVELYTAKRQSVAQISNLFKCSENRINYWLTKYEIKKRTIADAMYQLKNPLGDPFKIKKPKTLEESALFAIGLGLYWGEGAKRGNGGVRLTNSDPRLIKKFMGFLEKMCGVDRNKLRFSVQIFSDLSRNKALNYWAHELSVKKNQFYKTIVSKVRGKGTYKYKSEYGVIIVYFNNIKLKRLLCEMIDNIR